MNILLDMDGVICTEEKTFERALARPIPGALESIAALRSAGNKVIIYTARSWAELEMTKQWLADNGIDYDGIHMGKPIADRIIDDRALTFSGWAGILEAVSRNEKPDVDELYLGILREATAEFLREICSREDLQGPVVEVGPMVATGKASVVYKRFPSTFVDVRSAIIARGLKYVSVDIDAGASPDICSDVLALPQHLRAGSVGTFILMSCLEHMPGLFEVPALLRNLLMPNGRIFVLTPWNLRFHGPRPDCWRISDDGYQALFGKLFDVVSIEKIPTPGRALSPVGLKCVFRKLP